MNDAKTGNNSKNLGNNKTSLPKNQATSATVSTELEPITNPEEMLHIEPERPTFSGHVNVEFGMHQVISANCIGNNQVKRCNVIFDGGSPISFIQEGLAKDLGLKVVKNRSFALQGIGALQHDQRKYTKYRVKLQSLDTNESFEFFAYGLETICHINYQYDPGLKPELLKWGIDLGSSQIDNSEINCLIGADFFWDVVSGHIIRTNMGIVGIHTKLGWCIQGRKEENSSENLNILFSLCSDDCINDSLKKFWELEEVKDVKGITASSEIVQKYWDNISYLPEKMQYSVCLPWKPEKKVQLSSNYNQAFKRLHQNLNRLKRDDDLFWQYNKTIMEYVELGFAEKVSDDELVNGEPSFYLPHKAVFKESESSPCRIVFDGSSHGLNEYSLNDCLDVGGNLNPDIFSILLKFRMHKYGVTADCSKAFLRILLKPEEHKYCRYLWVDQRDLGKENPRVVAYAMKVVLFGLRPSTFILASVIKKHLETWKSEYPEIVDLMMNSFYVDDLILSLPSKPFSIEFVKQSRELIKKVGMDLCKFKSNLAEVDKKYITDLDNEKVQSNL